MATFIIVTIVILLVSRLAYYFGKDGGAENGAIVGVPGVIGTLVWMCYCYDEGELFVSGILPLIAAGGVLWWWILGEKEEARKKEEEAKRQALQNMLETPWWSIPAGSTLLIDTCVWMGCNKPGIETWFAMLRKQAYQKQWKILVLREVYEEIIHHTESEDSQKAADARHARKLISQLQNEAGREEWFVLEELGKEAVGERYADPALIEAAVRMPRAILVTFDMDLKIRAIEYAKAQGKHVNIFTQEVYYICIMEKWEGVGEEYRLVNNNDLERLEQEQCEFYRVRGVEYDEIFNDFPMKK